MNKWKFSLQKCNEIKIDGLVVLHIMIYTDEEKVRLIVELHVTLYIITYMYICMHYMTEVPELEHHPDTPVYTWPELD
jgi:hypothetical protein